MSHTIRNGLAPTDIRYVPFFDFGPKRETLIRLSGGDANPAARDCDVPRTFDPLNPRQCGKGKTVARGAWFRTTKPAFEFVEGPRVAGRSYCRQLLFKQRDSCTLPGATQAATAAQAEVGSPVMERWRP